MRAPAVRDRWITPRPSAGFVIDIGSVEKNRTDARLWASAREAF